MQRLLLVLSLNLFTLGVFAQSGISKKGQFQFEWGYNLSWYTKSDIHFTGDQYDFTLSDVKAKDRQSKLDWDPYFRINQLTIPQYNVRAGYFINNKYNITVGWDHMKYVVVQDQVVSMSGNITDVDSNYNGSYNDDAIKLTPEFLTFEHTDGLNYAHVELRRYDELINHGKMEIDLVTGAGLGGYYPRTNIGLMNFERADQWHWSGYGASLVAGINATFYDHYFLQSELKGGFIQMNDVLSTYNENDRARHNFFYNQWNVTFGARFKLKK